MNTNALPVVALTLGDPAGIGPELIARLLADPATCVHANVVLVGDPWLWEDGQTIAGIRVATTPGPRQCQHHGQRLCHSVQDGTHLSRR